MVYIPNVAYLVTFLMKQNDHAVIQLLSKADTCTLKNKGGGSKYCPPDSHLSVTINCQKCTRPKLAKVPPWTLVLHRSMQHVPIQVPKASIYISAHSKRELTRLRVITTDLKRLLITRHEIWIFSNVGSKLPHWTTPFHDYFQTPTQRVTKACIERAVA